MDHDKPAPSQQPASTPLLLDGAIAQARFAFDRVESALWDAARIDEAIGDLLVALDWAVRTAEHAARVTPDLADRIAACSARTPGEPSEIG